MRCHIALREEKIAQSCRFDRGDAVTVARDRDRRSEPGDLQPAVKLGQCRVRDVVGIGSRCGSQRAEAQTSSKHATMRKMDVRRDCGTLTSAMVFMRNLDCIPDGLREPSPALKMNFIFKMPMVF